MDDTTRASQASLPRCQLAAPRATAHCRSCRLNTTAQAPHISTQLAEVHGRSTRLSGTGGEEAPEVQPLQVWVGQRLRQLPGEAVAAQQDLVVRQQHQLLANCACAWCRKDKLWCSTPADGGACCPAGACSSTWRVQHPPHQQLGNLAWLPQQGGSPPPARRHLSVGCSVGQQC